MTRSAAIALLIAAASLLAVLGCGGRGGDGDGDPTPTSVLTSRTPVPTFPANAVDFDVSMPDLALSYAADWRIGAQTETSISFTPRKDPASAVLTVQWSPTDGTTSEIAGAFLDELEIAARDVRELEDIRIGGVTARRFASAVGSGIDVRIVLHVIFVTRGTAYLATFSATPEAFSVYAAAAEDLIAAIQVSGR